MDGKPIRPEWIDEIVCKFSTDFGHGFTEEELEELVLSLEAGLNDKLKAQLSFQ
jgi:hypothetical protein